MEASAARWSYPAGCRGRVTLTGWGGGGGERKARRVKGLEALGPEKSPPRWADKVACYPCRKMAGLRC